MSKNGMTRGGNFRLSLLSKPAQIPEEIEKRLSDFVSSNGLIVQERFALSALSDIS